MKDQSNEIKSFIINKIINHPDDIVAYTSDHFGVTRTTVHRHLSKLCDDGVIVRKGTTRNTRYYLASEFPRECIYKIKSGLEEAKVYSEDFEQIFSVLETNLVEIFHYGFTEIFNNAIEHSGGSSIKASTNKQSQYYSLTIKDDGVGAFKKLNDYFQFDDIRESVFQLTKGKMTTDPMNHTGEGVFFTSRVFDQFEIIANGLRYFRDNQIQDWSVETLKDKTAGTTVTMRIHENSKNNLIEVFKAYEDLESLEFDRTEVVVALARFGDEVLMSRSQAKRVLRGLERFKRVTLDFSKVRLVGQGFVDEVFRVYASKHPDIHFEYINANDDVDYMIRRGLPKK